MRLRKYRWQLLKYCLLIKYDLRKRGLAFADEHAAHSNYLESLSGIPLGPIGEETLVKLRAMNRDEAINYYKQFGELKQE
jgi:hypothetical protein